MPHRASTEKRIAVKRLSAVLWLADAACAVISLAACSKLEDRIPEGATVGCVVASSPDPPPLTTPEARAAAIAELSGPEKKAVARTLVATSENSSLNWQAQHGFVAYNVEGNATDNRGDTAGRVGFTSETHDMLAPGRQDRADHPDNPLPPYFPALAAVDGTVSTQGLDGFFVQAWRAAAMRAI